jgi:hypothetical protein
MISVFRSQKLQFAIDNARATARAESQAQTKKREAEALRVAEATERARESAVELKEVAREAAHALAAAGRKPAIHWYPGAFVRRPYRGWMLRQGMSLYSLSADGRVRVLSRTGRQSGGVSIFVLKDLGDDLTPRLAEDLVNDLGRLLYDQGVQG